jgi:L-rhamnose mutarotase
MPRVAFKMKLFPGVEDEYEKRHERLWPELKDLLKSSGIKDYSIFFDQQTGILFACLSIDETAKLEDLPGSLVMKKWWEYMKDLMDTNPDGSPVAIPLKEVFYLQ